ncbi:MAG TPA: ATP-dependent DNA helicase RecG [Facklamia tabacinasalis]|nr:ATP-dependent DNA helicase RecG [Ruoffia tabacinasalis]
MDQLNWNETINKLNGVGPVATDKFASIGVNTIRDLMFHFPFRYEDLQARPLESILDGEKVTLKGTVVTPAVVNYFGGRKSRLTFRMSLDEHNIISVSFFNQPYLAKSVEVGQEKAIFGKWHSDRQNLLGMKIIKLNEDNGDFNPVYSTTKGLKQTQIIKAIKSAFEASSSSIVEVIPDNINHKYRLLPLNKALYQMHFPKDAREFKKAERKIIFQEFFLYQWRLQATMQQSQKETGIRVLYDNHDLKEIVTQLPYQLTEAQKKAVNEICYDLLAPYPMRRMLQGDVGSGKTLVAFLGMMAAVLAGYQAVLMVPTEILAKQHVVSFNRIFEDIGYHSEILVSAMKAKEKKDVLDGLASGRIRIVIGTHALIQPAVTYKQLGIAIIDEQHRFGVDQRHALMEKVEAEETLNILQMTATPIPRSLAQTIYGDMTVSTIDQLPKGRIPIETKLIDEDNLDFLYNKMVEELKEGHQIYYVLPIIDQSEHLEQIENVNAIKEKLSVQFPEWNVGALHGQLSKDDQQQVMNAYEQNKLQILVATTMVEVGVDVPNATIIVIHSAERFGLAQLHQLRGRVGRSNLPSYCYLIGKPTTEQGKKRLEIMEQESDGFIISQEDMKIRGMGDILGLAQSGIPQFKYANLFEDQHIHKVAKDEVTWYLNHPLELEDQEINAIINWLTNQQIKI